MLRKGLFLADRYEILEQVGTGGMSDVYKAKCHKLNRYVAIKVLKKEFSEDKTFVTKFREEAQSAAGLTHPNVVNVYDVGDEEGVYYIVMELVEGITLKKYIEKRGKLPYKEAVSIAIQVAKGMEAAHSHHIVHRDIKPQNIIISRDGKVKVTDFGIAKAATSSTINSSAMGSVHYISPEQARGGYSDERSDIYSFGITLYEMITGKVPFDGDSTVSVAVQHVQETIPSPSSVVEDVPVSVDRIVGKCTQKKTDMRYQSASELIEDLKKSLVMPDVDFVKMGSVYGLSKVHGTDNDMEDIEDEEAEDIDDMLLDDDEDDDPEVGVVAVAHKKDKQSSASRKTSSVKEDYDEDDEKEERIDTILKWVGIIIGVLIIIITVVLVVRFVNAGKNNNNKPVGTTEATTAETQLATTGKVEQVEVPMLIGLSEDEAKKRLNERGLGVKISNQSSTTVEAGTVMNQSVQSGSMVDKNSTVVITVSIGPDSVQVPNIVGYTQTFGTEVLEGMGLAVESVIEEFSNEYEIGKIIRVEPEVGSQIAPNGKVTIVISKGKEKVTMPNLVGLTKEAAIALLETEGLTADVQEVSDKTRPYNQVISQEYDVESKIEVGTAVKIYVNIYKQSETETATKTPETEADSESSKPTTGATTGSTTAATTGSTETESASGTEATE